MILHQLKHFYAIVNSIQFEMMRILVKASIFLLFVNHGYRMNDFIYLFYRSFLECIVLSSLEDIRKIYLSRGIYANFDARY